MAQIEAVVFDIGNVLIEWHPEDFYDSVIGEDRRKALFAEVDLDSMNKQVDLGGDLRELVYGLADEHPAWRDEIRLWHDRWSEMLAPDIPLSAHLMRQLQAKGMPVFSLTNFGDKTYDIAAAKYGFLNEFDRDFVSGRMGVIKPDPAFYAYLEQGSGVAPDRLLFTDDNADNIAAAAARGWHTHHFTGPEGWAERLVAEGLLDRADLALAPA